MKRVSIIIPTYTDAEALPKSLEKIFAQTYQNIEVVVVNDGSPLPVESIVALYRDRILFISQENQGAQRARNNGIARATGEYILVCDPDVNMQPDMIEKMVDVLERRPEISFVYSSFRWGWKMFSSFDYDSQLLKKMNYINTCALVRREHHPGFDESIRKFQDWDVWLTMDEKGFRGYRISEALFTLGEHKGGISSWLPKIAYKIPWKKFGIRIHAIEKYEDALKKIKEKHHLS